MRSHLFSAADKTNRSRRARPLLKCAGVAAALTVGLYSLGCGGDFLGLEDYQRDLIFGIGALGGGLVAPAGIAGPAGPAGPQGPQGLPGEDAVTPVGGGTPALACWDLNGNGLIDPGEDTNGDGAVDVLDCQGAAGEDGAAGQNGATGVDGADGAAGTGGPAGAQGAEGPAGPGLFETFIDDFFTVEGGSYGALNLTPGDNLPIVPIVEPVLGSQCNIFDPPDALDVVGYRVAISKRYTQGNPVTMTLYFWRQGPAGDCFVFRLDAFKAGHGTTIGQYGGPRFIRIELPEGLSDQDLLDGILLVIDLPINNVDGSGLGFPNGPASGILPQDLLAFELNTLSNPFFNDEACYTLIGATFFESETAMPVTNALVFESEEAVEDCQAECDDPSDCPDDGDPCTDNTCIEGMCGQVNNTAECDDGDACTDGDECSEGECVAGGPLNCDDGNLCNGEESCDSQLGCLSGEPPENCCESDLDCDDDDECTTDMCLDNLCVNDCVDPSEICPELDLVFIMDTSGSMDDEADALCDSITAVVADLASIVSVNATIWGIDQDSGDFASDFACLNGNVLDALGANPSGSNLDSDGCDGDLSADPNGCGQEGRENWGPGTAAVAAGFDWTPDAIRVIVPISDEGPCLGGRLTIDEGCSGFECPFLCCADAPDADSIANAIEVANAQVPGVIVSPIISRRADTFLPCVEQMAQELAAGTGGIAISSDTATAAFAEAIRDLVLAACETTCGECQQGTAAGIPDDMILGGANPGPEGQEDGG